MSAELHTVATVQDNLTRQPVRQNVRKLAESLGLALNIPAGSQLVMVLGTGNERTNLEALETWVRQSLIERDQLPTREAIPALIQSLEDCLLRWQEGETW